ncbi:Uncharacterised protein [Bordetella ansorpii]|uniref:Lipoprotein n=1 Tax=Bordetella ansorpii TaxID=288768 RepID=A0A157RME3_9BORD|nr:hypothetical protein [Bordetella ansorpii]SAI59036.1 Uncharacterised protein [Bordetella ansorpii]
MKRAIAMAAACSCLVLIVAGLFAWAQIVTRNDDRLFHVDDEKRMTMLARACGKNSELWAQPQSGRYACAYQTPHGQVALDVIPESLVLLTSSR